MTTLLDVWNAGTGFASQALNMLSEEKKYVQDVDLFNASMDFENRKIQIAKARETIYDDGGINYQNNPNYPKDFRQYLDKELGEWRQTWGQKYADSRYFTDNLHEIESRGGTALNQALAQAEVNYAIQRVNVTYQDELNRIDNNPNLGLGEKRALMLELTERTRGAAGWDEAAYDKNKKSVLAKILNEELDFTAGEGLTVEDIRKRYDTLAADSLMPGNTETGEEGGLYAALPKAREAIAIGRDAAVASQQAYNFQQLKELDGAYDSARRNYATAVAIGDPARVDRAYREMMNAYALGKPRQKDALGKGAAEYNPDNRIQIMAMFEDPLGLPKPGPEAKKLTSTQFVDNLVQQWINGFNPAEFSMDAAGQLTGFQVTNPITGESTYYTGLSLNAIYQELNKYAEASGGEYAPAQLHYEFDKKLLARLSDNAETSAAKRMFSQLISFTDSQWNDIEKRTGMEQDAIQQMMMGQVLDAYARYSNAQDSAPQKNAVLEQALKGIRDQYIGKSLYFLYDNKETSEATYTRNALGSLGNLGKALDAYHTNPDINLPGRSGGRNVPAHLDDNFRAYTNRAEAMAREELGAAETRVEGGDVIAIDKNGSRYRIGGTAGGDIFLYQDDENGGWTPIAKRQYTGENLSSWAKTDVNGEVRRASRPGTLRGRRGAAPYEPFEGL
ncbi:MAG: hypothetical protein LBQ14_07945 [Treponema sp.]|nr:hypothetical protein [Treponema sp.]